MLNEIRTINEYIFRYLKQFEHRTAFVLCKNENKVSYGDFLRDIYITAKQLMQFTGKNIGIIGENSYEWLVVYLAIICSGNCAIPIDTELPDEDINYIINYTKSNMVFYSKTFKDIFDDKGKYYFQSVECISMETVLSDWDGEWTGVTEVGILQSDPDRVCMIVFTSGTLNKPKGVMLSEDNIMAVIQGAVEYLRPTGSIMAVLPFNHTYSLICGVLSSISYGVTIIINDRVKNFSKNLKQYQPEMIFLVPLFVEKMYHLITSEVEAQKKGRNLKIAIRLSRVLLKINIDCRRFFFFKLLEGLGGKLNTLICGGAPISEEHIQFFRNIGIRFLNGYGITECAPLVAVNSNKGLDVLHGCSVGKTIPTCEVMIKEPGVDGNGEVWVRGRNTMKGYWNDTKSTEKVFDKGWFNTGDIGNLDKEGYLYITGRSKNMILRSNGKNVYPEEIELLVSGCRCIDEVIVYCDKNDVIVAEIYPQPDAEGKIEIEAHIERVNQKLPLYGQIGKVLYREEAFKKTTSQKIKRY